MKSAGLSYDDAHDWYRDAVIYELSVKGFCDGNGDGIGDFVGLCQKLDYLQELGVDTLWLLPFYPSPMRDDGYDIADYYDVAEPYGTLEDFDRFLEEAHRRGLRVITELVINHTSDQHPWFERARQAPKGSPARDFYVWSDDPEQWSEARIIFFDVESSNWTLDPVTGEYFWHRFYSHQPDLNYENPLVHEAIFEVVDFWLDRGVDGMRLDAIPYLYEEEGTNCENLPRTHQFLKKLHRHVHERHPECMLLAEANQPIEEVVEFFGTAEEPECDMAFHFPLMPRMYLSLATQSSEPLERVIEQTPSLPEHGQWALFLRNHDELTLEMVTEEERAYMYERFAPEPRMRSNEGIRRRLAPLLDDDRRQIELLHALLLAMPGTPVLYYGDEIGMGDNIYLGDRHGVRTPMQWSPDRNAGFSEAPREQLYLPVIQEGLYTYLVRNVEAARATPSSLFHFVRRLLEARQRVGMLGRAHFRVLETGDERLFAFERYDPDDPQARRFVMVANLSETSVCARLELSHLAGASVTEVMGAEPFCPVTEAPYPLTLAGRQWFWLMVEPDASGEEE